jgi:DNA-binding IclR family transcriptional regulator
MVNGQRSMMLKEIAAAADMPASKAHRYLVSLIRAGLVEQDPMSSRYDLGPFALNIGLVALDRLDRVRLGLNAIAEMRDEINQTTALAVWGDKGPVVVRWERPRRPITVNVITGTVLELLSSATGRVFAAWCRKRPSRRSSPPSRRPRTCRRNCAARPASRRCWLRSAARASPTPVAFIACQASRPSRRRFSTSRTKSPWPCWSSAYKACSTPPPRAKSSAA